MKIERILGLEKGMRPLRMLEIGTGSGGIAHYFANHPTLECDVVAVDVLDSRLVYDGFMYRQVQGVDLPFDDGTFDVVITNHVIEHVGDRAAQEMHLQEAFRVMRPNGIGYLAVPNRWMFNEPHYRLMFLSWLPRAWRTPYLRLMRRGEFYDCEPLQLRQLERMLDGAGFRYRNMCVEAWRATLEIEEHSVLARNLLNAAPDVLLKLLRPIIPTLIYRLERPS